MTVIHRVALMAVIVLSTFVAGGVTVYKVPVSHGKVGVIRNGEPLEMAAELPDTLIVDGEKMTFRGGRLTDGEGKNGGDVTLKGLWRKHPGLKVIADNWWRGSKRLKLWFFNPNGAGTLFAELAVLFLAVALLMTAKRKQTTGDGRTTVWCSTVRIVSWCLFLFSVGVLLITGSRGAFVAMLAGAAALGVALGIVRGVHWRVAVPIFLAVVAMLGCVLWATGERFGKNLMAMDESNLQRVHAWVAAPEMLAASPNGWGDFPGIAYDEWFQAEDDRHVLYYLVNTHLTWITAHGRVFSFFYVAGWLLLFLLLAMHLRNRRNAAALGVWVTFFVANWFSTLGFFLSLWIIPVLVAALASPVWFSHRSLLHSVRRNGLLVAVAFVVAFVSVVGIDAYGRALLAKRDVPVRREGRVTYVGNGERMVFVVPDQWVLSRFEYGGMGRDIRTWCSKNTDGGVVAVADSLDALPAKCDRLVLVGRVCLDYLKAFYKKEARRKLCKAKEIVFVSPRIEMNKMPKELAKLLRLDVWEGEFTAEIAGDANMREPWFHIVPGCELYLPRWMEFAMNGGGK